MNPEIAQRLREMGQYLEDVDEAYEFVADTLLDGPDEAGAAVDHLIVALRDAT
jgi:hypothetical protein